MKILYLTDQTDLHGGLEKVLSRKVNYLADKTEHKAVVATSRQKIAIITVIVPIYKTGTVLMKTLRSIQNQTFTDFECLLIDDGSEDAVTAEMCSRFECADSRFHYFYKANEGIEKTRLFGVKQSTTNLIMFCDHDDYYGKDTMKILYQAYQKSGADIVVANCFVQRFYQIDIGKRPLTPGINVEKVLDHEEFIANYFVNFFGVNKFPVSTWGKLYQKSLFKMQIASFGVNFIEDIIINLQVFERANKIHFIPEHIYTHVYGGLSSSFTFIGGISGYAQTFNFRKNYLLPNGLSYRPLLIEFKNTLLQYIDKLIDERTDRAKFGEYMSYTRMQNIFRETMVDDELKNVPYLQMIASGSFDELFENAEARFTTVRKFKCFIKQIVKKL